MNKLGKNKINSMILVICVLQLVCAPVRSLEKQSTDNSKLAELILKLEELERGKTPENLEDRLDVLFLITQSGATPAQVRKALGKPKPYIGRSQSTFFEWCYKDLLVSNRSKKDPAPKPDLDQLISIFGWSFRANLAQIDPGGLYSSRLAKRKANTTYKTVEDRRKQFQLVKQIADIYTSNLTCRLLVYKLAKEAHRDKLAWAEKEYSQAFRNTLFMLRQNEWHNMKDGALMKTLIEDCLSKDSPTTKLINSKFPSPDVFNSILNNCSPEESVRLIEKICSFLDEHDSSPDSLALANWYYGCALELAGDLKKAESQYRKVIDIDYKDSSKQLPTKELIKIYLANNLVKQKSWKNAKEFLSQLLDETHKLKTKYSADYFTISSFLMGKTYQALGNRQKALELAKTIGALSPGVKRKIKWSASGIEQEQCLLHAHVVSNMLPTWVSIAKWQESTYSKTGLKDEALQAKSDREFLEKYLKPRIQTNLNEIRSQISKYTKNKKEMVKVSIKFCEFIDASDKAPTEKVNMILNPVYRVIEQGYYEAALARIDYAQKIYRENNLDSLKTKKRALNYKAWVYLLQKKLSMAQNALDEADSMSTSDGDPSHLGLCLKGKLALLKGEYKKAEKILLNVKESSYNVYLYSRVDLARVYFCQEQFSRAKKILTKTMVRYCSPTRRAITAEAGSLLALCYFYEGHKSLAEDLIWKSTPYNHQLISIYPLSLANGLLNRSKFEKLRGNKARSRRYLTLANHIYEELGLHKQSAAPL